MIDLHIHILSGLDDGAKTVEEAIRMCLVSFRDGVRTIVAAPHTLNGVYLNDRETVLSKVRDLNKALTERGFQYVESGIQNPDKAIQNPERAIFDSKSETSLNSELSFRVLPGADVHFSQDIPRLLDQGEVTTIGDGGRFLCLEFPHQGIPYGAEGVLFQLMARGIIPVISHPERNLEIARRPQRYFEMVRAGCLGQVTAMSITGEFGPEAKTVVEKLMKKRLVHFIASDAHAAEGRDPVLSRARRQAEKIMGEKESWKMVKDYPRAVLEGKRPDVPDPIPL